MEISPRYDAEPLISLDGPPAAIAEPLLRQRRRLLDLLGSLGPGEWVAPSRCEGWRVQDVVAHLTSTDGYWALSIASGLAGEPTRILQGFDPKATPAALVDAVRDTPAQEALDRFAEATGALCAAVEALDEAGWSAIGESPAGHVTVSALAHHALWDAWVHERDVLVPLGRTPAEEPDEILASLRYAAALAPGFAIQTGGSRAGAMVLEVTRPDARVVVLTDGDVRVTDGPTPEGALVLIGDAVEVLEALSVRRPWRQAIPEEHAWLLAGLSEVFESTPS